MLASSIAIFSHRLPLEPVMILWVNLFDSVFLTMPLMMEPKVKGLLEEPPRNPKVNIANRLFFQRCALIGCVIAGAGFYTYHHYGAAAVSGDVLLGPFLLTQAQTAAFNTVMFVHLGFVMSARRVMDSAFTFNPFSNKWLLWGIAATIISRFALSYVPFLQAAFRTASIPTEYWLHSIPFMLAGFFALEADKFIRKQWQKRKGIKV